MALTARLQIGDNNARRYTRDYLVIDLKCHIMRRHNEVRPDSDARCERIELTVIAPGRDDLSLYEWYVTGSSYNGRVLVDLSGSGINGHDEQKEIRFEDAVCFAIAEDYSNKGERRRELRLSFVAEQVIIDDHTFNI
jgi:hypothetical protein